MTRNEFQKRISAGRLILDGATGSNLQKRGMPTGVCPEAWILEHPQVLIGLQKEYIAAGSDLLYTPTFSGNRIKLEEYGLADQLETMNQQLVSLSRQAVEQSHCDRQILLAGDITMTGQQLYPMGTLRFEELVTIYKEQIRALERGGVDLIVVETMMSLQECRAAVLAVKECSDLPVMVTLTFNEDGRTLFGTDPATAALVMTSMEVDAIGVNCSTGPEQMCQVIREMTRFTDRPLIAKPNAGLPRLVEGNTLYDLAPEEYAQEMLLLVDAGADLIGGCCGTTPEHIRRLHDLLLEKDLLHMVSYPERQGKTIKRALSTERTTLELPLDGAFKVIGERINPTGKKALQAQLRDGNLELVGEMAEAQVEAGAAVLDVNMGMNGIDEKAMMERVVYELSMLTNAPLSLDSSHPDVIEQALRIYPGRALINSISLESGKMDQLIPAAKKYGAMFIVLPLSDKGLPENLEEKKQIIDTILQEALAQGMSKEDMIVDGLVATIGANKKAALETLETIRYCHDDLKVATACGLSNISFGLPERAFVNSAFMAMAIQSGLTMAIANPSQDLLMHTIFAADLLQNKPESDISYIERVTNHKLTMVSGAVDETALRTAKNQQTMDVEKTELTDSDVLMEAVIKGRSAKIEALVTQALADGREAQEIIDQSLIPGINQVGRLFDQQVYYLPQLIASAETMEKGIHILEPILAARQTEKPKGTIVIATVEHDIHDIGKNLVALMLRNYGYQVIDLGKDVPAEMIVQAAVDHKADIIGLSALMTTTMMEMKKVVALVREQKLSIKIMIGGAVITQGFADEIGADGYSPDAQAAVALVEQLLQTE